MSLFEHKIVTPHDISPEDLETLLNKLNKEGWTPIFITIINGGKISTTSSASFYIILQRPKVKPKIKNHK